MIEVPDSLLITENELAAKSTLSVEEIAWLVRGERRVNTRRYFGKERRKNDV